MTSHINSVVASLHLWTKAREGTYQIKLLAMPGVYINILLFINSYD